MSRARRLGALLWACALLSAAAPGLAQDETHEAEAGVEESAPEAALPAAAKAVAPVVSIDLVDTEELRLFDAITFYVKLAPPPGAGSVVDLADIRVTLHGLAAGVYDTGEASCELVTASVAPGENEVIGVCGIVPKTDLPLRRMFWLMLRPKARAFATIKVAEAGGDAAVHRVSVQVPFQAPLLSPYIGAVFGALALAALGALWRLKQSTRVNRALAVFLAPGDRPRAFWSLVLETVAAATDALFYLFTQWGFAAVSSFVVIVLGQSMSAADAPIQVSVTNFWGGVAVGLLAISLNAWLLEKLGLKRAEPAPAPTQGKPPKEAGKPPAAARAEPPPESD